MQINQVIDWIESKKYYVPDEIKDDAEELEKLYAYLKKEWLSALLETKNPEIKALYEKYQQIEPTELTHAGHYSWMESREGSVSPIESIDLRKKSNEEIAAYLSNFKGKKGWDEPTGEGLSFTLRTCAAEEPIRFSENLEYFQNIPRIYQNSLLAGLSQAWNDGKDLTWENILSFISNIIAQNNFWSNENYRTSLVQRIAELISDGTRTDKHAFDEKLLPQAEDILLTLVEKTKSDLSQMNDLLTAVLNSPKGKIFSAMILYSLRCTRISKRKKGQRWTERIKNDFNMRLNRDIEPSLDFSVILGQYLLNLHYLDENWVTDNIDKLFPKENEAHWKAAFTAYLFFISRIDEKIYFLLKQKAHYGKAIVTDFGDSQTSGHLVQHICIGYLQGWEKLEDSSSLISKLIKKEDFSDLSEIINFLWRIKKDADGTTKKKIKPLWKEIFNLVSQKQKEPEYQIIISNLAKWLIWVEEIDKEVLNWAKLSAKYIDKNYNSYHLVEGLLIHVTKTPNEVGEIYLESLNAGIFPDYKKEDIQKIVRTLYKKGEKDFATKICNLYGEKGFDFLKEVFDEYRNENK